MSAYYNDIDPYACRVLRKQIALGNLPPGDVDERSITDVSADDLRGYAQWHLFAGIGGIPYGLRLGGVPDDFPIITGGFPCQPHSLAGARRGGADARNLWPEYARLIGGLRPRWVLAENVPGLLTSEYGRFFGGVLRDLAACGYDAEWDGLPASAVGAPHRRDRVWLVAYPEGQSERAGLRADPATAERGRRSSNGSRAGTVADPDRQSLAVGQVFTRDTSAQLAAFVRSGGPGAAQWAIEPDVDRVVDGVPHRVDRLRGLGNSVVPQVVAVVGRAILAQAGAA